MIHWILAYKHPIFIRQAFLRHPATSLPRAHSPPRPLLRYRLRRRGRRDRNLLFLNFSATPRARTIRRKFLAKLFEKVSKYLIIRLRKIRYGEDDGIVDIDQAHQEFIGSSYERPLRSSRNFCSIGLSLRFEKGPDLPDFLARPPISRLNSSRDNRVATFRYVSFGKRRTDNKDGKKISLLDF